MAIILYDPAPIFMCDFLTKFFVHTFGTAQDRRFVALAPREGYWLERTKDAPDMGASSIWCLHRGEKFLGTLVVIQDLGNEANRIITVGAFE